MAAEAARGRAVPGIENPCASPRPRVAAEGISPADGFDYGASDFSNVKRRLRPVANFFSLSAPPAAEAPTEVPVTQLRTGRRVRWLIWAFALFIVAIGWVVPLQRLQYEKDVAIAAATRQNENRAIMLEQYVERTLEAAEIATFHIAERYRNGEPGLHDGTNARPATIRGTIAGRRSFVGVSIADASGDVVASTLGPRVAGQNVRGSRGFDVHAGRDIGAIYVGRPVTSPTFGRDVIWMTRRINNADGSFGGVVAINITPDQLIGFNNLVSIQPTDVVSLIGLDGITRARRTGDVVSSGEDVTGGLVMRMQRNQPNGTYIGPSTLDGGVRIFSHRRLSSYPLFATYGVMLDTVLEPVNRRRQVILVAVSIITLITLSVALILTSLLRRRDRWAIEMAQANRRLEEAQRVGRIGDWRLDLVSGAVEWSPQLFEMYERDPAEGAPSLGQFYAYLDEESRMVVAEAIERAIATGEPQNYELTVHLPNGTESHRLVSAIPTRGANGRVVRLHGTDQDVSARKKMDRLEAEVSHLSRLEAMNAMAGTLAHELNQPLAAASNYLVGSRKMLVAAKPRIDLAEEGLRSAQQQVQFAGEIIRRVRSMVSNEPKQLAPASIARIIDDAIALGSPETGRSRVKIRKKVDPDARFVRADRIQIQQVLLNLIRNAREAVAAVERPSIVVHSSRADADFVRISVEDNGRGFQGPVARLFMAFTSDKPTGLGLGLSISRTIVESHGGRILVENRAEGGACVSFTVPAGQSASDEGGEPAEPEQSAASS